jgi:hypothetical protein
MNPLIPPQCSVATFTRKKARKAVGYAAPVPLDYYQYDYCMVVNAENAGFSEAGYLIMKTLNSAGLNVKAYLSIQKHEIVILIGVSFDKLTAFADLIDYKMLLDAEYLERIANKGDHQHRIDKIDIAHRPDITRFQPCEYIYGKVRRAPFISPVNTIACSMIPIRRLKACTTVRKDGTTHSESRFD